jgi:hypothetical protein
LDRAPYISRVIKSEELRWTIHVARLEENLGISRLREIGLIRLNIGIIEVPL